MSVDRKAKGVRKSTISLIAVELLAHYDRSARSLPWRIPPRRAGAADPKPDPYRVWLSEIMLQQTTVAAVTPYFQKFLKRWPTVHALAGADDADVMAAWAGLGYYARARNLLKCARMISEQLAGEFPDSEAELLKLPGVGPYTAAAIAAIAFDQVAVVVDANVERVASRLFNINLPLPGAKSQIYDAAKEITPTCRSGDFAQAMMDLGATICTSKSPKCDACPLSRHCMGLAAGEPEKLPVKAPKKSKPHRTGVAFAVIQDKNIWLIERPDKGMLAGMRALPDDGWSAKRNGNAKTPFIGQWQIVGAPVHHSFTHFSLELALSLYCGPEIDVTHADGRWWPLSKIEDAGLPTLFKKAVAEIIKSDDQIAIR